MGRKAFLEVSIQRMEQLKVTLKLCKEDCSDISVKVSYQLQAFKGWNHPQPILDHYMELSAIFQCRQELVMGLIKELTTNINLTNSGEDSHITI
ncbi:LOW QUALITY PROTEIN: integrin alpha-E [Ctenodactylus gundi]